MEWGRCTSWRHDAHQRRHFLARKGLRESRLSTGLMVVAVAVGVGFEADRGRQRGGSDDRGLGYGARADGS